MNLTKPSMRHSWIVLLLFIVAFAPSATGQTSTLPKFGHVIVVVEENTNYSSVVGSSSMPYLNSLINSYGLSTNYYADTHPSIGNYFALTTGQILTNDDSQTPSSFPVSADNIVRELNNAGVSWKDYAESIPSVGYTGGNSGNYYVRHNPVAYFTDVNCGTSACIVQADKMVPFTQFATDLAAGTLPQWSLVIPNACDDAHNCSLSTADTWLKTNIDPLVKSAQFQTDGLLIIVFDENSSTGTSCTLSSTNCGGQVADVIVSPLIKSAGIKVSTSYNHESTLRLMTEGLGLTTFPGRSSSANDMSDFFGSSSTSNTPVVSLSPTSLSFGTVNVGSTSTAQSVTLTNTGNATLNLTSIAANGDFFATNTCGTSLAAGSKCTISVTFSPTVTGTRTGDVTLTDNASNSPQSVGLSGTGGTSTTAPAVSLSPTSLSFGSVNVGTTSAAQSVTLTNTGNATLSITGVTASSGFAATNGCGTSVAAGAKCSISVTFSPTATGTVTGQVVISDNASNSPQAIGVSGTGASTSTGSTLSPSSLTFASQTVGTTSAPQVVTLRNTTSSRVRVGGISTSANFGQSNNCPNRLSAGGTCTINVTFKPSAAGTLTGSLVATVGGTQASVALTGTGTTAASASASLSPASLTFGSTNVSSTSAAQTVTLTNSGSAALSISGITASTNFAESNNCGTSLAAGAQCSIGVTFTPTTSGTLTGSIVVSDNASNSPQSVSLSGTGASSTSSGGITMTPTSLSFGSVAMGSSSASQAVILHNGTSSAATMYTVFVGWSYTQTNNCGSSLAAGASCTIYVTFKPLGTGTINENLAVDAGGTQLTTTLTGNGT